ncbi:MULTISPECIES: Cof-type HAD-IIB family hydrolase [Thiomicrorhabdus]|uniref:HAD family phosphatase n=1 Tax=Thiomicrorhabdus heinhorstiae TaxID=2748010 RepID=A0ABS0BYN9_9GAMM|nr:MULTISPECIES: Cof-type HAD-IIB family hydrolase [Thiomicrorhabdus]MBF6058109.1 HAD family phosphatase [Thiomicrorhabdus heinhorstiae]
MIKLVVIDLDGTLLNPEHVVSEATLQALRALHRRDIQLMIATGRHFQDVYMLARQLDLPVSFITSNGARVHDHHGNLLYENHIPDELVGEILDLTSGYDIHRNIYQGDVWLVEEENEPLLAIHHASGFEYQLVDFADLQHEHIDKFYFNARHDVLVPIEASLQQSLGDHLTITFTTGEYLEVMNKGVSKGKALQSKLDTRGILAQEVMAFGDGMNDIEMLELVGHPVLMANAAEAVKARLPQAAIAKSNADDGVADYLQRHLLNPA